MEGKEREGQDWGKGGEVSLPIPNSLIGHCYNGTFAKSVGLSPPTLRPYRPLVRKSR